MPVGNRSRHGFGPEIAGGTWPILHDKRLLKLRRYLVGNRACNEIDSPSGQGGHDNFDRPLGVGLRRRT